MVNMKNILFVASEAMPFASSGGLGDVISSLPSALVSENEGVDVRVIMPLYSQIGKEWREKMKTEMTFSVHLAWRELYCGILSLVKDNVKYYFVDNEYYFKRGRIYGEFDDGERFAFFCMAVTEFILRSDFKVDILHAHDWQSALSIVYCERKYKENEKIKDILKVFTIHNIEYQGKYSTDIMGDVFSLMPQDLGVVEYDGCINLMKAAIECADKVTTVSPKYASEILGKEHSSGLDSILLKNSFKLCGILNGIDCKYYDPNTDPSLAENYNKKYALPGKKKNKEELQKKLGLDTRDVPLIAIVSRLVTHKGLALVCDIAESFLKKDVQFVILGCGDERYERFFKELETRFFDKVRAVIGYDRDFAKTVYAAADIFLMPSKSEPCGLSQMIASRYGAIPVVHAVGGLYDSIKNFEFDGERVNGNGFTFFNYSAADLLEKIFFAVDCVKKESLRKKLVEKVMSEDFSFSSSASKYLNLYKEIWG